MAALPTYPCCWSIAPFKFWKVCKRIIEDTEKGVASVFGYMPGKSLAKWFKINIWGEPSPQAVTDRLLAMLCDARTIIEREMEGPMMSAGKGKSANADVDYFTWCDVGDDDIPWKGDKEDGSDGEIEYPLFAKECGDDRKFRFVRASKAWENTLSLG